MRILLSCLCLVALQASALELKYLNQVTLANRQVFKKTKIGSLSGLSFDSSTGVLSSISDDRGNVNEPRIYQFMVELTEKKFSVEPKDVIFLTVNQGPLSHKSTNSKATQFSQVLDLEGIAPLPWGDFLIANEGDMNHKPRVPSQVLDVKSDGTIFREFQVPNKFLPELTGQQTKGTANNLSFEGVSANPNGKQWVVATEAPLIQDGPHFCRFIEYTLPDAWVLKPAREWAYPIALGAGQGLMKVQNGVSEVLFLNDHELLVLERGLDLTAKGLHIDIRIYKVDLNEGQRMACQRDARP